MSGVDVGKVKQSKKKKNEKMKIKYRVRDREGETPLSKKNIILGIHNTIIDKSFFFWD